MTIKELESRTGMVRANIRFYEEEGLLSPRRLANGYRDYSEEDARTLEKIKLLRQLQLDIDTIRKVQQGTLTLEQALFVQTTKLEGDRAVIERAAEVCRELERSGVEYAALEPQPYLLRLEAPQEPGRAELPPPAPLRERDNEPRACYHPWQRMLARSLDMTLYGTIINVGYLLLTRDPSLMRLSTSFIGGLIWEVILLALTLGLEPFWLHYWGWTPGKWLFGLKLRDGDGEKLSVPQARGRSWRLAWEGYGWNIPILDLWRMWRGRVAGLDGRDCPWDGEEGYRYTKVERQYSAPAYIAVGAICWAALVVSGLWSTTPPCRGDLTVAEFAQNYNFYFDFLGMDGQYEPTLDEEGRWSLDWQGDAADMDRGNRQVWDEPEYTVENGRVTAVTFHMETQASIASSGDRESIALAAMTGSVDGLNLFNYDLLGWAKVAGEVFVPWKDVEKDYRGLRLSQQVEYTGYQTASHMLWSVDGEERHCEKTVTISLID